MLYIVQCRNRFLVTKSKLKARALSLIACEQGMYVACRRIYTNFSDNFWYF